MSYQQIDSVLSGASSSLTANPGGTESYGTVPQNRLRVTKQQDLGKRRSVLYHDDLTRNLMLVVLVACLGSFQFGYHTGELNTPKEIFTSCQAGAGNGQGLFSFLPACVHLTEFEFSVVTGMFPLGGIGGSIAGGFLIDSIGRKGSIVWTNVLLAIGSLVMSLSSGYTSLLVGRLIVGIAGGLSLVVVPSYIAEVASIDLRGLFGICNQFSIVFGTVVSQSIGLAYADISTWRFILCGGMVVSLFQAIGLSYIPESPWFLISKYGDYIQAEEALRFLRCRANVEAEITERSSEPSCESPEYGAASQSQEAQQSPPSILRLFRSSRYRAAFALILFLHMTQQMSGVSAIMYYSTTILTSTFGDKAKYVTVLVNVFQLLFTYIASRVIERWGRRSLMIISCTSMGIFSIILAIALNHGYAILSATALFLSIGSFALGLGPLPFMLAPELFDSFSIGFASALGLATNLTFNFFVASAFLPISEMFPADQPGSVFFIFAGWLLIAAFLFYRILPETRASTAYNNLLKLKANVQNFVRCF